jgi:hypothetical protein
MCAQLLKPKYFPNGDLLKAKTKYGISYSWRSILNGVAALKKWLVWRVGNGERINIWLDPWIPSGANRRPVNPRGQNILTCVSDLIDPDTCRAYVRFVSNPWGLKGNKSTTSQNPPIHFNTPQSTWFSYNPNMIELGYTSCT